MKELLMKELLRSHSISYVEGLQIALEGEGIKTAILDEQAPGYLGFAGRARLVVALDSDYERAMAVVRALEPLPADPRPPRSWAWQRWGLLAGGTGLVLLVADAGLLEDISPVVRIALLAAALVLLVIGLVLIVLGPRRDRESA